MAKKEPPHHLRVVTKPPLGPARARADQAEQTLLFPHTELLAVVQMGDMTASRFVEIVERGRPKWMFDLRPLPRFDLMPLTRHIVFDLFEALGIKYFDVAGIMGVNSSRDARLNPGFVGHEVASLLRQHLDYRRPGIGPIYFLIDSEAQLAATSEILPRILEPRPPGGWIVQLLRASDLIP